ncbi:hypothetical protein FGB62_17g352 [Gracilaria domingensis]|nr:hypothetical protein FGB62_17g352 [Gracilaria domingensis]
MLTANCAHPPAWLHYLSYLTTLPEKDRLVSVADRAVRNVPNCIPAWSHAVLAAPYDQDPVEKLSQLVERAEPFVTTSEDYAAAEALSKHAWSVFLALGAPQHLLPRMNQCLSFNVLLSVHWASAACYAATILASVDHVQSAIQLFESVISARPTETRWRLQFANAVAANSRQSVRDMFQQGMLQLASPVDANILRDAWQAFELSIAPNEQLLDRLRHIDAVSAKRADQPRVVVRDEQAGHKRSKKRGDRPQTSKKQKLRAADHHEQHSEQRTNETTARISSPSNHAHNTDNMEDVAQQPSAPSTQSTAPNGSRAKGNAGKHVKRSKQTRENANVEDDTPEPNTIFVSNLPFNVKEEDLRQFFGDAGLIRHVRLPLRSDGAPKGIAYVEFEEDAAVQSAVGKHLHAILGRTVSVKRSKPPQKRRAGKKSRASSTKRRPFQPRGSGGSRRVVIPGVLVSDKDVDMTDNVEELTAKGEPASDRKPMNQDDFRAMLSG